MAITLANADSYIARILGGANDTNVKAQARDALLAASEDFIHRNDWKFLLVDTAQTFTVVSATTDTDATVTTAVPDGFKNVLVGMTVTGTGIPASTTVSSITSTTSIELSAAATATGTPTLTFGGTIPIIASTSTYKLPTTFWKPHSCRLTSSEKVPLTYITQYDFDATSYDQTTTGAVRAYTIYNTATFDASGTQQTYIKFFRTPQAADVALLRYYRPMDQTASYVDIPDEYLYTLMDLARVKLLQTRNASDNRLPLLMQDIEVRVRRAIDVDRTEGGQDQEFAWHTPNEMKPRGVFYQDFYPRGDW